MSNTIFKGVASLPTKLAQRPAKPADAKEFERQLFQEIEQRHEAEILARPYAYNWGLVTEGDEYVVGILVSKLPDQLKAEDLDKLQKPVGGLRILLDFSDGEVIGHAESKNK